MEFENMRILNITNVLRYQAKFKRWRAENRKDHIVGVKLRGKARHDFENQSFVLSGNCIYFLNQKDDYEVEVLEPGEAFSVHFTTVEPVCTDSFSVPAANTDELIGLLEKLERKQGGELAALSVLYRLCGEIDRIRRKSRFPGDQRILAAKEYMDANFRDADCYARAVAQSGLSDRRFRDLFQGYYNLTPVRYLVLRKMELAKQLLQAENMSIGEVSRLCGFSDVYYFSRTFKKEVGVPPSRWNPKG